MNQEVVDLGRVMKAMPVVFQEDYRRGIGGLK